MVQKPNDFADVLYVWSQSYKSSARPPPPQTPPARRRAGCCRVGQVRGGWVVAVLFPPPNFTLQVNRALSSSPLDLSNVTDNLLSWPGVGDGVQEERILLSEKIEMVDTTRWPPGISLEGSSSTNHLTGWPRDVFTISIFHSCNKITLAAVLALVNYDVTNKREQLRE